jgi:hypothetical protein
MGWTPLHFAAAAHTRKASAPSVASSGTLTAINLRKIGKCLEIAAKRISRRKMKVEFYQREPDIIIPLGDICSHRKQDVKVSD